MPSESKALSRPGLDICVRSALSRQLMLLQAKRLRWVSMTTAAGLPPGSAGSCGLALGTYSHSTNTSPAGALLQLVPWVKLLSREKQRASEAASSGRGEGGCEDGVHPSTSAHMQQLNFLLSLKKIKAVFS